MSSSAAYALPLSKASLMSLGAVQREPGIYIGQTKGPAEQEALASSVESKRSCQTVEKIHCTCSYNSYASTQYNNICLFFQTRLVTETTGLCIL